MLDAMLKGMQQMQTQQGDDYELVMQVVDDFKKRGQAGDKPVDKLADKPAE